MKIFFFVVVAIVVIMILAGGESPADKEAARKKCVDTIMASTKAIGYSDRKEAERDIASACRGYKIGDKQY